MSAECCTQATTEAADEWEKLATSEGLDPDVLRKIRVVVEDELAKVTTA